MNAIRLAAAATAALGLGVAAGAVGAATSGGPVNSSPPSVSGTVQQGQRLSASTGSWSGGGTISYSFQWQRCSGSGLSCGDISGATSQTYDVGSSDVGRTLRVVVTATSSSGSSSAASSPTGVVAAAGSAPRATKQPDPHGTAQVGKSVSVDNGSWSGTSPITYSYQWQRCSSSCADLGGATKSSYTPVSGDVGYRLRAIVTAKNSFGSSSIGSNLTAAVLAAPAAPASTSRPTVSAPSVNVGGAITGSVGAWSSAQSISYGFGWNRCDASGNHCQTIAGATAQTYVLTTADAGSTIEFVVKATNATGSNVAVSAPTPVVTNDPPGTIRLPNGKLSIPASSVVSPDRLVVSAVGFSSYPLRSRRPFTARVRIVDGRGYLVRDALVRVTGIPYGWVRTAAETATGENGVAAVRLVPTRRLPLRKGEQLVLFVRARRPATTTTAAESAHRLVQLALAPPRKR